MVASKNELESRVRGPLSVRTPRFEVPGLTVAAVVVIEPTVPVPASVVSLSAVTAPATVRSTCNVPSLITVVPV